MKNEEKIMGTILVFVFCLIIAVITQGQEESAGAWAMTLNIFSTAVIFVIVFTGVMQAVDPKDVSDKVAFVLVAGFALSGVIVVLSALVLVWAR